MKNVNKVLIKRVNYLSIAILTITLLGIVSISIATDYAVQAYNIQATSNSLVDLSFFGDYELYQNFSPEAFTFETSLPITHVFISHKTFASACFISTYDNLTWIPPDSDMKMFIFAIDFSLFQTFPFNETVKSPHYLNNSSGVYISSQFIRSNNLSTGENFSLYDVYGSNPTGPQVLVQQALYNITLIDELVLENEIWFMQMFGLYEYWDNVLVGEYGIILMDSQYYSDKFRTEEGEEVITLLEPNTVLNYIFDKTGVLDKKPSAITNMFTTIIEDINSSAGALGYEFSLPYAGYSNFWYPFLFNIEYYTDSFNRFRMFLILGSFPIFLFGWWVNKTFMNLSLKSQLKTLSLLQCKGVSKTELRKKILLKSIIIGVISWTFAVLLSQFLSLGLRYYLFEYEWTSFFSINKVLNTPTLILLPIGLGISFLSTLSALNTSFRKYTDILGSESEQREPRIIRRQSKKRAIVFGIVSLLPFFIFLFPVFGITILESTSIDPVIYTRLVLLVNLIGILALVSPFFFIIAVIDLISQATPKTDPKSKRTGKKRKALQSYSLRIVVQRIARNLKAYAQFTFIISLSITLIAQSITYNNIVEINDYQTGLAANGNGFELRYEGFNESYSHFQQVAQDMRKNGQIKSLVSDDVSMFRLNDAEFLGLYPLRLINISEWKINIEIPRDWASLPSDEIYSQLEVNGSILVSDRFLEDENYQIGDTLIFNYENIDGQQVEKEIQIIGSYTRFPLTGIQNPPLSRVIIADISFFQDVKIRDVDWIFYPNDDNTNLFELYKLIQTQIYESDSQGWIGGGSSKYIEIAFPEPSIPYSKFLQIEAISLAIIILIGLALLLKRQFEAASTTRYQFRMKGMSKNSLRKIYFSEFLMILLISLLIFIPAYCISLQAIFALNLTINFGIPYVISVPFIGILLLIGVFFGVLLITYSVIAWSCIKKTDRKEKSLITIT